VDRSVGGSGSCGAVGWARAAGAHRAHELVAIDVDDPLHLEGEEDVEEEHLVVSGQWSVVSSHMSSSRKHEAGSGKEEAGSRR